MSDDLPRVIPIFPLAGVLLLPRTGLPLHIFEERYRNLVADVLEGDRTFGLIQPFGVEEDDEEKVSGTEVPIADDVTLPPPSLYDVGCLGRIETWEQLDDGRYVILVHGVRRFRVERELPEKRGYRQVEVCYDGFAEDEDEDESELDTAGLLTALTSFAERYELPIALDKMRDLPGLILVNTMAMALPFQPAEKQALLEASDPDDRQQVLESLMAMGFVLEDDERAPVTH